ADIPSTCSLMVMTMIHDERPGMQFLYVANKEGGLKIYSVNTLTAPVLVTTVPISAYGFLDVMNLSQEGNYLYLAIGNTFTNPQQAGLAVIDINTPGSPIVKDFYVVPGSS